MVTVVLTLCAMLGMSIGAACSELVPSIAVSAPTADHVAEYKLAMPGDRAPDFSLPGLANRNRSLSDFKGMYVILEWIDRECPHVKCRYECGRMLESQNFCQEKGIVWLSICSSKEDRHSSLSLSEIRLSLARLGSRASDYLIDDDADVARLYGVETTPHMFLISPEGVILYSGAVDDSPSVDVSQIKNAVNYVQSALEAALAGKPVRPAQTVSRGCPVTR